MQIRGNVLWLAWLAFAVWLTFPAFLWELNYFHSPGPRFFRWAVALLIASPVLAAVWHALRRRWFWKFDLVYLAGLPALASAIYQPAAALVLVAVCLSCFAAGRRVCKRLHLHPDGPVEDLAISTALGFGILHFALFWMGVSRLYYPSAFIALLALMLIYGWREILAVPVAAHRIQAGWSRTAELSQFPGSLWLAFALLFIVATTLFALSPSVVFDVLRFHLPAAQYDIHRHALATPPWLPYAYYPQSVETVMALGYALAGRPAAQLLPVAYFILAVLMLFRIGRVCGLTRWAALIGLLFTVSVPAIHWTGGSGKNDFALVCFILAALLAGLRWIQTRAFQWIFTGVFFLAMAAGVKHIVLFAIPPLALLYGFAAFRQVRPVHSFLALAAVFLAFGLMWYVRAWIATGNPVYPARAQSAVSPGAKFHHSFWRDVLIPYARLPWDLHFRGRVRFESVSEYPMGIVLIVCLPLWLLVRKRGKPEHTATLLFAAGFLLYWAIAYPMIRYGIAGLAIVLMISAGLLAGFYPSHPLPVRAATLGAVVYAMLFGLCGIAINEINAPQLRYFAGRIGPQEYLREALAPYRALEFLKTIIRPGQSVLSVDTCALAYAPDPGAFDCVPSNAASWNLPRTAGYAYIIVPQPQAAAVPARWKALYSDSNFTTLQAVGPGQSLSP